MFYSHFIDFALPLIVGNILHMWMVKGDYLAFLNRPLSIRLFGENKGSRAFIVLPLFTAITSICLDSNNWAEAGVLGFGLGLVYLLSELPNSFLKRALGIPAGERSIDYPLLQALVDKSDSLIGTILFYLYMVDGTILLGIQLFGLAFLIHNSLSYLFWKGGFKSNF